MSAWAFQSDPQYPHVYLLTFTVSGIMIAGIGANYHA